MNDSVNLVWLKVQIALTAVAGVVGKYLGGWDGMLVTLVVFICVDYLSGVICAIKDHTLSSAVGFTGIARKVFILILVGIGNLLDINVIGEGALVRSAVIMFYLSNEGVSILENASRIGLPIPEKLKDILAQLHKKSGESKHPDDGGEDPQSEGK